MIIIHIIAIAIITVVLSVMLKQYKNEIGLCISIAGGVVILLMIAPLIRDALDVISNLTSAGRVDDEYVLLIIRVVAVSYITEIGAGIARDAGEGALAVKVELGGKLVIFSMCVPILISLIEVITGMIT